MVESAFFFSTIFDRMSGATVAAITIYFVCYIVEKLPFADRIEPYLLSKVMNGGSVLWLPDIPYGRLVANLSTLAIYIAFFCMLSIINFNVKDIKKTAVLRLYIFLKFPNLAKYDKYSCRI